MGVVVFDSDVLIGFLHGGDAHHSAAVEWMRTATAPGTRRALCAANYAEVLVGPIRSGTREVVDEMLGRFAVDLVPVDERLAERAASVRAETGLRLPDAFALATCLEQTARGTEARLATFDRAVLAAEKRLR